MVSRFRLGLPGCRWGSTVRPTGETGGDANQIVAEPNPNESRDLMIGLREGGPNLERLERERLRWGKA